MAFGLVGDGSECYGFDDEISRDHDFGPRIMLWLTPQDLDEFGEKLQKFVLNLPRNFLGYSGVNTSRYGEGREGVFTIPGFYKRFIGMDHPPSTIGELPVLGQEVYYLLSDLAGSNQFEKNINTIESICGLIISKLREMGLSDSSSDFLLDHGPRVQKNIKDKHLRNIVPWG